MEILRALEGIRTAFFDKIMAVVTYLGDEAVFLVIVLFVLWCVDKKWGIRLLFLGLSGNVINQLLKAVFCIPRPWIIDPQFTIVESARAGAGGYSFPSGHTQGAASLFGGIAIWKKRKAVTALCAFLVLLTGFSRMYLGVHTPLDVGVSLAIGLLLTVIFYFFYKREPSQKLEYMLYTLVGTALCASLLAYLLFAPKTAANIAEVDAAGLKTAFTLMGSFLGMIVVMWVDRRYIKFSTKAVWWAQILKFVLGLAIILAVKTLLKQPLYALLGGSAVADAVRYFTVVIVGGIVWPMTFKWWSSLGKKSA
ncbi:MAG: phosphatase PAP2 family protein [Oscillospiraceae bacterium]